MLSPPHADAGADADADADTDALLDLSKPVSFNTGRFLLNSQK